MKKEKKLLIFIYCAQQSILKMGTVTPMQMDFSVRYNYRQLAWVGFSYRKVDAIIGIIGFNPSRYLEVGYAFDFTLSKIKTYWIVRILVKQVVAKILENHYFSMCSS